MSCLLVPFQRKIHFKSRFINDKVVLVFLINTSNFQPKKNNFKDGFTPALLAYALSRNSSIDKSLKMFIA